MKTHNDDVVVLHPAIALTGRMMFTLIFFLSGITHFTDRGTYVALMPAAIPLRRPDARRDPVPPVLGDDLRRRRADRRHVDRDQPATTPRCLADRPLPRAGDDHHGVAMATATDPEMQAIQTSFFLKGLAMIGTALLITQLGVKSADPGGLR